MSCYGCRYYTTGFDKMMGCEYNACQYPEHGWENFPATGCEDKNKPLPKTADYCPTCGRKFKNKN